jgi:hypothetical protein
MSSPINLSDSSAGDDESSTYVTISDSDSGMGDDEQVLSVDVTAVLTRLAAVSGIPKWDIKSINIRLNPLLLSVCRTFHDSSGNVVLDINGNPLTVDVAPVAVTVDMTQLQSP